MAGVTYALMYRETALGPERTGEDGGDRGRGGKAGEDRWEDGPTFPGFPLFPEFVRLTKPSAGGRIGNPETKGGGREDLRP